MFFTFAFPDGKFLFFWKTDLFQHLILVKIVPFNNSPVVTLRNFKTGISICSLIQVYIVEVILFRFACNTLFRDTFFVRTKTPLSAE